MRLTPALRAALFHSPNLELMRLPDKIRLSIDIKNTIAVPMMSSSCDQVRRAEIVDFARFCVFGMDANIEPGIDALSEISWCEVT